MDTKKTNVFQILYQSDNETDNETDNECHYNAETVVEINPVSEDEEVFKFDEEAITLTIENITNQEVKLHQEVLRQQEALRQQEVLRQQQLRQQMLPPRRRIDPRFKLF